MADSPEPNIVSRTYAVSRAGAPDAEYEDAARVAARAWPVMAAVADGATESMFSGRWAELLVDEVTAENVTSTEALQNVLPSAQASWRASVSEEMDGRPWYVSTKALEGAHATLLGLSMDVDGEWRALGVGDCCLFHLRQGRLLFSWPYESADLFDDRPDLLPSRSRLPVPRPRTTGGRWQSGDVFLLATDALAAWLLERGVSDVISMTEEEFRQVVASARSDGTLRNDDVTLVTIETRPSPASPSRAST